MATIAELKQRRAIAREKKRTLLQRFRSRKEQIKRLTRKINSLKKNRRGVPNWLPDEFIPLWNHPWTEKARTNMTFRTLLWSRGYASPNFTELETRCKRGDRVPSHLIKGCQDQAFRLEECRHDLGDVSLPALSWYRPEDYNAYIGGAPGSKHIQAIATDFDVGTVSRIGRAQFDAVFESEYTNDGFGQYPSGSRHGDVRGYRARWTSY